MRRTQNLLTTAFRKSWLASARVRCAIDLRRAALSGSGRQNGPSDVCDAYKVRG